MVANDQLKRSYLTTIRMRHFIIDVQRWVMEVIDDGATEVVLIAPGREEPFRLDLNDIS